MLEQLIGSQLDLLVLPLGSPIETGDQPHPVDSAEIPVDEAVSGLGLVGGTLGQTEVPRRVLLPVVGFEVCVLVLGARLDITPLAAHHVLTRIDELAAVVYSVLVDEVLRRSAAPQWIGMRCEPIQMCLVAVVLGCGRVPDRAGGAHARGRGIRPRAMHIAPCDRSGSP